MALSIPNASVEIYFSKVTLVRVRVEVGGKKPKFFKLKTPDLSIAISNHKIRA